MPLTITSEQAAAATPVAAPESITLTPEQIAAAQPVPETPPGSMNVLRDFSADQLVALSKQNPDFNLAEAFRTDAEASKDPTILAKASEAYHKLRTQGLVGQLEDVPVVGGLVTGSLEKTLEGAKRVGGNVGAMLKGGAQWIGNVAGVATGEAVSGVSEALKLGTPEARREQQLEVQRRAAETVAGTESAVAGLIHQAGQLGGTVARATQIAKPLKEYTPEEQQAAFQEAVFRGQLQEEAARGHGPLLSAVAPETVKALEAAGKPVRPEEVASLAGGDPLTFMLFGKGITSGTNLAKAGGRLAVGAERAASLAETLQSPAAAARVAGGKTITGIGRAGSFVSSKLIAKGLPAFGAVTGAVAGSAAKAIPGFEWVGTIPLAATAAGAIEGWKVGQHGAQLFTKIAEPFKKFAESGRNIAAGTIKGSYEQLGRDIFETAPGAAAELAKGAAFDLGLAMTMDTPQEKQAVGIGATFGLLGGAARTVKHAISGQLIAPRELVGSTAPIPGKGNFPSLEQLHRNSFGNLAPGQKVRLNASTEFARSINPNLENIFVGKDNETIKQALLDIKTPDGNPVFDESTADLWSAQNAMTFELNNKKIVIVSAKGLDSAPHEARHAIENVIGENALRELDREVQARYPIDALGRYYTRRVLQTDPGPNWAEAYLDVTKRGNVEAAEKLIEIATEKYNDEAAKVGNPPPSPAEIRQLVENDWKSRGTSADWRTVLTPEEAKTVADRGIAREIEAENFDAWFKHVGKSLEPGRQIPEVLARWANSFLATISSFVGHEYEPLRGRVSDTLRLPLSFDIAKATAKQARGVRPVVEPAIPGVVKEGPAGLPKTPEEVQKAATDAAELAKTAPDVPEAGGTKSPREILGIAAEAIANRSGLKLNYLSAPEEPAAAISSKRGTRREMIELYRRMPEAARKLWEKLFFPEKVTRMKNGKYQVVGWAPEVFAANAQKLAEVMAKNTAMAALSPYDLDAATGSFTRDGWQNLYDDVKTFVRNQQAGFTGSGQALSVPTSMRAQGFFEPPKKSGDVISLDQNKADFINMLFNFQLPKTGELGHGKFPLNVAGQEVSQATLSDRLVEPATPVGEFSAAAIKKYPELAGRRVLEVNPLRNKMEIAAGGKQNMPSFLEAVQALNLDRILEAEHAPEAPQFRGNTLTLSAGFAPREVAAPRTREEADRIVGAKTSFPARSYKEAAAGKSNPWVRQSDAPDNTGRTLLMQFSSDFLNPPERDVATGYYDKLYSGARPGYARLTDFWEIPQWMGFATHMLGEAADVYVVRDMAEAKQFLNEAGYDRVAFSSLDVNADHIKDLAKDYPGQIDVGGFAAKDTFKDVPNIRWHDSMKSLAEDASIPYKDGVDYRHFAGSDVIPRLTLSSGCKHKCAFCTVEKNVVAASPELVSQQADAIAGLGSKLVYLNDKTFGQASNYQSLADVSTQIKSKNPDFQGFIVQTTASQMTKFSPEWLAKSGIQYVELGIESYNDPILHAMHKPATESVINKAVDSLRQAKITLIPNVIIGLPGETEATYAKTLQFLKDNADIISHANIYNLAVYKDAELGKKLTTASPDDFNENVLEKSFHTNPELHRQFAGDLYGLGMKALETKPVTAQFAPEEDLQPPPPHVKEVDELWAGMITRPATPEEKTVTEQWAGFATPRARGEVEFAPRAVAPRTPIEIEGPDGKKYKATFDGYQDFSSIGKGMFMQITPLEDIPGVVPAKSTTYDVTLKRAGYNVPDLTTPEIVTVYSGSEGQLSSWFTINPERAKTFGLKTVKVDLPQHVFSALQGQSRAEGRPTSDIVLPKEWADKAQPVDLGPPPVYEVQFTPNLKEGLLGKINDDEVSGVWTKDLQTDMHRGLSDNNFRYSKAMKTVYFWSPPTQQQRDAVRGWLEDKGHPVDRITTMYTERGTGRELTTSDLLEGLTDVDEDNRIRAHGFEVEFAPGERKTKNDYKLKEGPGEFSKAWILPNGRPVQLGGTWHHAWINQNPEIAKKFDLVGAASGEENRVAALQKGFARVNYAKNTGTFKVEARAVDWPKLKESVREMARVNLDKIDNMDVHLLDEKAKRIVEQDGVALHTYDPEERMDHLPLISEPTPTTVTSPQATPGILHSENVQFAPKNGPPGAITMAAIRDPETKLIYEGLMHWAARMRASEKGIPDEKIAAFEEGFSTTTPDEFLNRADAMKRAVELNQYVPNKRQAEAGRLESVSFERQQRLKQLGYAPDVQYAPRFESVEFEKELKKIREGFSGGQTFNSDGTLWTPPTHKVDLVSLASLNVPLGDLTPAKLNEVAGRYEDLLDEPNVKLGVYAFSSHGEPTVSVDVNAVVPQKYRDNTVKFAKANDQVAIWDAAKNEEVRTGGKGDTKLTKLGELYEALDAISHGRDVDVRDIIAQNAEATPRAEQALFEGMGGTREALSSAALGNMTKSELAAHFPESVVPKTRTEFIDSNIVGSPLYKAAKDEAGAIKSFGRKLTEFAKEYADNPVYKAGLRWYSDFVPQLKKEFGKFAPMMAELLAATSPRTAPDVNFRFAMEAVEGFKAGRYNKQIAKFVEGLEMLNSDSWKTWYAKETSAGRATDPASPAAFTAHWVERNKTLPLQSNGKKFGMNSDAVLRVMARSWLESVKGPKVSQFVRNLLGIDHGATIDVWANRTMRRLGYSGFVDRWRLLPKNEAPVSDEDFYFSQKAFADAAKQLGVLPDALQGGLWFAEKQLWADRGYGNLDLGSYSTEIKKAARYRQEIAQRLKTKPPVQTELLVTPRTEKP